MKIINNRGKGAGGAKTNLNGISFEEKIYLKKWIELAGYKLNPIKVNSNRSEYYEIKKNSKIYGYYGRQSKIYDALKKVFPLQMNSMYINKILSKKINPDAFILTLSPSRLTIFEKKWQQTKGSVDEKIQTGPFKLEMFEKLLKNISNIECSYQYILSSWFKKQSYRNIKEYYENNSKINIWVQGENLKDLKMEDYIE